MIESRIINICEMLNKSDKILSGRGEGKKARKKYNLDKLDEMEVIVVVKIAKKIWSVNSSFFLGCFGESVRKLGEEEFRKKYFFECEDHILDNIEDGISRAINIRGNL